MTDDAEADGNHEARSQREANPRWVAWAALGGSLIGALTGLTGSLLVYKQSEDNQEATANQRTSDIRRTAYTDLVSSFQTFKTEASGYRNLVFQEASVEDQNSQFNDKYVPASNKLQQAASLVLLVGTESARTSVKKMNVLHDRVGGIFVEDVLDLDKFDTTIAEFTKVVDAFVNKVDVEVI
ncbi:hypothetical protein [Streptomyces sp. S.PNR 29]|uniref:hypothetical protein n=1 Tax=Streptomyces sp. S.PNR 29 TaxID=2973805 RepID=UPI0025B223AD|nr:hypothetical protein [Streptomyces sp. S.PNR 29]MDN0200575.1 hypothetical protein [Streptomyces sp. S.PNR 29]